MILARRSFDSVPVRLRLTDEQIGRFAVHRYEFPGVDLATRQTRHYPYGELGVHALGYVSAISEQDLEHIDRASYAGTTLIGKLGVESAYEPQLHGKNGFRQILVNAQGRSVQREGAYAPDLHSQPPTAGEDLVLSLDLADAAGRRGRSRRSSRRGRRDRSDATAMCWRSRASRASTRRRSHAASRAASTRRSSDDRRQAAAQSRAARHLSVRLDHQAGDRAGGADLSRGRSRARQEFCGGRVPSARQQPAVSRGQGRPARLRSICTHAIARSCDVYFYGLAVDRRRRAHRSFHGALRLRRSSPASTSAARSRACCPRPSGRKRRSSSPQDQVWFPGETVNFGVGQGYLLVTPLQLAHVAVGAGRARQELPAAPGDRRARRPRPHHAVSRRCRTRRSTGVSDATWDLVHAAA